MCFGISFSANTCQYSTFSQPCHSIGAQYVLAKPLLLQQFQSPERWTWIREVLGVFGPQKVLKVFKVGNESRVLKELLGGEMIHVIGVCERLDELEGK